MEAENEKVKQNKVMIIQRLWNWKANREKNSKSFLDATAVSWAQNEQLCWATVLINELQERYS